MLLKKLGALLLLGGGLALAGCADSSSSETPKIVAQLPDQALDRCVRQTLHLQAEDQIDLSQLKALSCFYIQSLQGLAGATQLEDLALFSTSLTNPEWEEVPHLKRLEISDDQTIQTLDLSKLTQLESLKSFSSSIESIEFGKNAKLSQVIAFRGQLKFIDLGNLPNLVLVMLAENKLQSLSRVRFFIIN